jgi:hypothetical protein
MFKETEIFIYLRCLKFRLVKHSRKDPIIQIIVQLDTLYWTKNPLLKSTKKNCANSLFVLFDQETIAFKLILGISDNDDGYFSLFWLSIHRFESPDPDRNFQEIKFKCEVKWIDVKDMPLISQQKILNYLNFYVLESHAWYYNFDYYFFVQV